MTTVNFSRPQMQTVQELLQNDTRAVPPVLLDQSMVNLGTADVPREVFFEKNYHDIEVEQLWKKVWQWACREEEIPEVGD